MELRVSLKLKSWLISFIKLEIRKNVTKFHSSFESNTSHLVALLRLWLFNKCRKLTLYFTFGGETMTDHKQKHQLCNDALCNNINILLTVKVFMFQFFCHFFELTLYGIKLNLMKVWNMSQNWIIKRSKKVRIKG